MAMGEKQMADQTRVAVRVSLGTGRCRRVRIAGVTAATAGMVRGCMANATGNHRLGHVPR